MWSSNSNDICQQWIYKEKGNRKYFLCKRNTGLALDLFTGPSSGANVTNYNAHVYRPTDTSAVEIEYISNSYIRIKLSCNGRYLTANQGKNGSSAGKDVNAAGNVYFYKGGLTDYSQDWKPILLEDGQKPDPEPEPEPIPGKEIVVTGMPSCWAYTGNKEYFHPSSGMVNGTWEQNDGISKANAVKAFYKKVFRTSSAPNDNCLYNLFGAKYSIPDFRGFYHTGIDMYLPGNGEIYSAHTGMVTKIGGKYGVVAIYDDKKDVTYLYLHMDTKNTSAVVGKRIDKDKFLGMQSSVGLKDVKAVHLHIEVRKGYCEDPANLPTINEELKSISPYDYL